MEFWGQEVKPGSTVSCGVGDGFGVHLSQAALGETKKESGNVLVFVKVGAKKFVIGTLSTDKHPQISCDLVFDEAFELSHNSKTTSVFLCGYKYAVADKFESDSGEDEDEEMEADENPVLKNETEKSAAKVPAKDDKKDEHEGDSESDSQSDSETSSGADPSGSDSEDDITSEDDSSDEVDVSSGSDESSDDSEDEESPVPVVGKKRASATALKASASDKKGKISTPEKGAGNKKGVHVATPHPAKQASKTPADGKLKEKGPKTPADSKAKEKSPKSGSHSCKSCSKAFNSAGALESHQKAKKH